MVDVQLYHGDCLEILPGIPSQSVDAVITDPPYPMIKRDYGMMTVEAWWDMMMVVCAETRRILKPTGSAVFILQPNSEHVGQMRGWLWEFMAWVCREWNMVQDVWWWNTSVMPNCISASGLTRHGTKACVWCGQFDCYRNQSAVLWQESQSNKISRYERRALNGRLYSPSGHNISRKINTVSLVRGGVTPFNVLPIANTDSQSSAGAHGHGAGTPLKLADWWTRYICPPGGTVADWFCGSGTMGIAAIQNGCDFIGIEKMRKYYELSQTRTDKELSELQLRLGL